MSWAKRLAPWISKISSLYAWQNYKMTLVWPKKIGNAKFRDRDIINAVRVRL